MSTLDLSCRTASRSALARDGPLSHVHGLIDAWIVEKRIRNEPENWDAWAAKADILCSKGAYLDALDCCDRSLKMNPENAFTWFTKGNILHIIGRDEGARDCFKQAEALEPSINFANRHESFAYCKKEADTTSC